MRKFFKSLAVLLALTLIVGVIPAAAADAPQLQKEKILYLGGSQGTKEDGTQCKTGSKKLVANMIKGFDKDTMNVVLSSADSSIVKANNKTGKIYAKSLGTTTVTVTVKDADDTVKLNQELKVIVKKNASDATFTVENLADGDKFTVGQTVTVKLPRKGVDTDQRSLVSSDDTIATVKEQADNKRVYDVTFVKAGEVTFTAKAYQSAKYPAKTAEKVMKVTVENPAPQKITQVADNAIEVEYASAIKDVITAASFKNDDIYYLIDQTKVPFSLISKVETDGNVAKLTFHSSFVANTTYYLNVADSDDLSFVAAGHELKDVDKIKLTLTKAYKETDNTITYAYYNAAGLDITNGVTKGYNENLPEFTITGDYAYLSSNADDNNRAAIYFTDADKTATIKAVLLLGYDETTFAPLEKSDEIVITSTNAPTAVYTGETKYTIVENTVTSYINKDSAVKSNFAIGDNAVLQIILQKKKTDGSFEWVDAPTFGITKVECGNENIAVVGADSTGMGYDITGISEGTTNIILYTTNASTGKYEFFRAYPITVKAARYAASIVPTAKKSNLNIGGVGDTNKIYITVYDQYGEWLKAWAGNVTIAQASGNDKSTGIAINGNNPITFTSGAVDKEWDIGGKPVNGFFALAAGNFTGYNTNPVPTKAGKDVIFSLTESTKSLKINYKLSIASAEEGDTNKWVSSVSKTALDTGLLTPELNNNQSNQASAELKIAKEFSGFKTGEQNFKTISKRPNSFTELDIAGIYSGNATGPAIYLVYPELDGDNVKYQNAKVAGVIDETVNSITLTNVNSNKQLTKGTYKFTVYRYERKEVGKTASINIVGTHTVTVTNNQKMPNVTVKSDKISYTGTEPTDNEVFDCFEFKFGSKKLTNIVGKETVISQNGDVYVKTITVQLPADVYEFANAPIKVTVNKLLTKK